MAKFLLDFFKQTFLLSSKVRRFNAPSGFLLLKKRTCLRSPTHLCKMRVLSDLPAASVGLLEQLKALQGRRKHVGRVMRSRRSTKNRTSDLRADRHITRYSFEDHKYDRLTLTLERVFCPIVCMHVVCQLPLLSVKSKHIENVAFLSSNLKKRRDTEGIRKNILERRHHVRMSANLRGLNYLTLRFFLFLFGECNALPYNRVRCN